MHQQCQRVETNLYVWTSHFHFDLAICSPSTELRHIKLTKYWSLLCCGPICQPHAHWLVCAQPLFLSVNSPLDHNASSSSSSSSRGPDLAECQYLGRTPACYHNDTLTHMDVPQASSQFKHQIHKAAPSDRIRTSVPSFLKVLHAFFHTILRQTRHICLIPYEWPGRSLSAWYSCGMGPGVGQGLKEWECLFSCHFDLHVIQIMSRTKQQALTQPGGELELQRFGMH